MRFAHRCWTALLLAAALTAPAAIVTTASAQDHDKDKDKKQVRVYDKSHKDYHNWDDREDRSYHQYLTENHMKDRDYKQLKPSEQNSYWNWRHSHPD